MASNLEEPSAKRRRSDPEDSHDDQRYRSIKFDMEKYDEWVRELSEDKLISVFELGVKVRETVYFTVDVNQDFMEKALSSQMQPVRETVANIERDVKQQVQSVQENVSRDVTNQNEQFEERHQRCAYSKDEENSRHDGQH